MHRFMRPLALNTEHPYIPRAVATDQLFGVRNSPRSIQSSQNKSTLKDLEALIRSDDAPSLQERLDDIECDCTCLLWENDASLLHKAVSAGSHACLKMLLKHGSLGDLRDIEGESALHVACEIGDLAILQELLETSLDVNGCDNYGWSPLHSACSAGNTEVVRTLMRIETIDPNVQTERGISPLSKEFTRMRQANQLVCAISKERYDVVRFLLRCPKVNLLDCNRFGFTAYDVACTLPNLYLASLVHRAQNERLRLDPSSKVVHKTSAVFVYESARLNPESVQPDSSRLKRSDPPHFALSEQPTRPVSLAKLRIPLKSDAHRWATEWTVDCSDPSVGEDGWFYAPEMAFGHEARWQSTKPSREHARMTKDSWLCRRIWVRVMIDTTPIDCPDAISGRRVPDPYAQAQGMTPNYDSGYESSDCSIPSMERKRGFLQACSGSDSSNTQQSKRVRRDSAVQGRADEHQARSRPSQRSHSCSEQNIADAGEGSSRQWQPDSAVEACPLCDRAFTFLNRRHHCRCCGRVVCALCSDQTLRLRKDEIVTPPWESEDVLAQEYETRDVRVCDACFSRYHQRQALERTVVDRDLGSIRVGRRQSNDSMRDCPVCGRRLDRLDDDEMVERHLQTCLENRTASMAPASTQHRYLVYELNADSGLVGEECSICFNEFQEGDGMARMECLCNFHKNCLSDWISASGFGCPLHMIPRH